MGIPCACVNMCKRVTVDEKKARVEVMMRATRESSALSSCRNVDIEA